MLSIIIIGLIILYNDVLSGDRGFYTYDKISAMNVKESINKSKGRDPSFSKLIKENYDYHCQICMAKSDFNIGTYGKEEKNRRKLIEAAHIKDASASGPGKLNNLLSLCKNCQDK